MKKLNLSLVAILAMSTFAVAGGDIEPVEAVEPTINTSSVVEETVVVKTVTNDNGFYLGLAYSATTIDVEDANRIDVNGDDSDSFMVQAGYKFNPYIAIEGRYWNGDNEFDAWGLYAKPMYPITPSFDIYALVGYGSAGAEPTEYNDISLDDASLQWGAGASYAITDSFSIFADYVELYNNDENNLDWSVDTVNLGVTYQF